MNNAPTNPPIGKANSSLAVQPKAPSRSLVPATPKAVVPQGNKNHVMDALHSLIDHVTGTSRVDNGANPDSALSLSRKSASMSARSGLTK